MRSFLFWAGLGLLPLYLHAQQIVEAEYYFDRDPGRGNGLTIPVTAADSINVELTVDLSDLSVGPHTLYVRVKDDSSRWSGNLVRPVYVAKAIPGDPDKQIVTTEYFFDTDPGQGQGFPLTTIGDEALIFAGLVGQTSGIHIFYVRVQGDDGSWSATLAKPIYITPFDGSTPSNIAAVHQAIISEGTRTELPTFTGFAPAGLVDLEYGINLEGMTLGSTFTTHISVEDAQGEMSEEAVNTVSFLDNPPVAVSDSALAFSGRQTTFAPLANDVSEDGDTLTILRINYTGAGIADLVSGTELAYTSIVDFVGTDTLYYVVQDEAGQLDSADVYLRVQQPIPPVFLSLGGRIIGEDEPFKTAVHNYFTFVEDADLPDSLLIWDAISGSHVSATVVVDTFSLVPSENWFGRDTVYLVASDGFLADTADMEIIVVPENDLPESFQLRSPQDGAVISLVDGFASFNWTASSDVDGDTLEYSLMIVRDAWDTLFLTPDTHALVDMTQSFIFDSSYHWNVEVSDGTEPIPSEKEFTFTMPAPLALDPANQLPQQFALHQNYPNPFNPVTTVRFDIPLNTYGEIAVYDLAGREVVVLLSGDIAMGYHTARWTGRDGRGRSVPSGIYIARLLTPEYTQSIKMVLLK